MTVLAGWSAVSLSLGTALAQTPTDESFNVTLNGAVSSIALQADGKVVIGGGFTTVNGTSRSYLARLNADGSLDSSFAPANAPAQQVARVVVAGSKIHVAAGDGIRRYDASGALDWHYPMSVRMFTVDSQQRVILGGQFTRLEEQAHRNIARLTVAGALDSTFNTAIGCCAGEGVDALAAQGDSILVGGLFQSVNTASVASPFARISADGSLDTSFVPPSSSRVLAIVPTADGKVLRVSEQTLARHLANGAEDTAFAPVSSGGSSEDRFVTAALGADGKAVVGGSFSLDGRATRSYVARFNPDGSQDTSFAVTTDAQVNAVAVQSDGRVLISGWFTEVNGSPRLGLARIVAQASAPVLSIQPDQEGRVVLSWPQGGAYVVEAKALDSEAWVTVPGTPTTAGGRSCLTNFCGGAGQLFRLRAL